VQAGLGAFESAPCYRELLERERRDGPVTPTHAFRQHDGPDVDVRVADPELLADRSARAE
jgi:hypothetical protein